jgi:hypothetical protein
MPGDRSLLQRANHDRGVRPVKKFALALLLVLAACAPRQGAQCDATATHEVAFSRAGAHDVVTARAIGPTCGEAIALYAVREGDGHLIWTWAGPLRQFNAESDDGGEAFVQHWARANIASTSGAPDWARLAPGQTSLDRLTYEDIRARNLPMLCHLSGDTREVCAFWEPAAGVAGLLLERNIEETSR